MNKHEPYKYVINTIEKALELGKQKGNKYIHEHLSDHQIKNVYSYMKSVLIDNLKSELGSDDVRVQVIMQETWSDESKQAHGIKESKKLTDYEVMKLYYDYVMQNEAKWDALLSAKDNLIKTDDGISKDYMDKALEYMDYWMY